MLGFKTKEKPKLTQSQAFEQFEATVSDAIHAAQRLGVWAATLAQHLEAIGNMLDANRRWR
jgi:hypothetical protein